MKAIKLLFLFFPFVTYSMQLTKIGKPGNPELLHHNVSHKLQKYAIAKQTLEDMRSDFSKLKINVENLDNIINTLPQLSLSSIDEIMYGLYVLTQIYLKQPNVLAQNISNILNKYLK